MAGHSKWAQIKRKKAATDAKRGRLFSRLARDIQVASQKGSDPNQNPTLRLAVDQAKAANMPNTSIERAIKKGSGAEDNVSLEEVWYGGFGPEGVGFLVRVLTDNRNRTVAELKRVFSKNKGQLTPASSVEWMFVRGVEGGKIVMSPKTTISVSDENAENLEQLTDEIEDNDDVQEVFTNAE